MGPGVDSATTATFMSSSWVSHFFFSTQISSMMEIIAYPPPKVNRPIFIKVKNSSATGSPPSLIDSIEHFREFVKGTELPAFYRKNDQIMEQKIAHLS
jgi:hypothetical protein